MNKAFILTNECMFVLFCAAGWPVLAPRRGYRLRLRAVCITPLIYEAILLSSFFRVKTGRWLARERQGGYTPLLAYIARQPGGLASTIANAFRPFHRCVRVELPETSAPSIQETSCINASHSRFRKLVYLRLAESCSRWTDPTHHPVIKLHRRFERLVQLLCSIFRL